MENDVHYALGVREVFDEDTIPIRDPESSYLEQFTGVVDIVVPDRFEVLVVARDGHVARIVPRSKKFHGAPLKEVVDWYLRHTGTYFVFDRQ